MIVRLTEDGPKQIRGNGRTWERGETREVDAEHAKALLDSQDYFELVDDEDDPICIRGNGEVWERGETREVDAERANMLLSKHDCLELVDD